MNIPEGAEARPQLVVSLYSYQDPAKLKGGCTRVAPRVWSSSTMRDGSVVETDVASPRPLRPGVTDQRERV